MQVIRKDDKYCEDLYKRVSVTPYTLIHLKQNGTQEEHALSTTSSVQNKLEQKPPSV